MVADIVRLMPPRVVLNPDQGDQRLAPDNLGTFTDASDHLAKLLKIPYTEAHDRVWIASEHCCLPYLWK